jgi:hypothetical protein
MVPLFGSSGVTVFKNIDSLGRSVGYRCLGGSMIDLLLDQTQSNSLTVLKGGAYRVDLGVWIRV